MHDGFAEAFLHAPHRILGIRLKPLCAAHVVHLEAVRNPLVLNNKEANGTHLLYALKVCALRPRLINGVWQIDFDKIKFRTRDRFRVASLLNPKKIEYVLKQWQAYVEDYSATPERMNRVGHEPAPLSSPAALAAVAGSLDYLDEGRAWSLPLGTLFSYAEIRSELKGAKVRFRPGKDEEEEILKQLKHAEEIGKKLLEERMSKNVDA